MARRACGARRIAACLLPGLLFAALSARADVDVGDIGAAAIVSPASNALVAVRRSEPRSEVALSMGAAVTDQSAHDLGGFPVPARNGLARAALELQGSWAPHRTWEIFATFNGLAGHWLTVNGQDRHQVTLGATTVGATWVPVSLARGRLDGGVFLRLLLPTSQEIDDVHAWGLQPGLTLRGVAAPWLAWFGGASFRLSQTWGSVATPAGTRSANGLHTGVSVTAGVAVVPASWIRLVIRLLRIRRKRNPNRSPGRRPKNRSWSPARHRKEPNSSTRHPPRQHLPKSPPPNPTKVWPSGWKNSRPEPARSIPHR
jgi:hypothetical protein